MNITNLRALRAWEQDRHVLMGWWLYKGEGLDLQQIGSTREPENACATAGCHAGNTWMMAGCPIAAAPEGYPAIGEWAAGYLELSQDQEEFLFIGRSHGSIYRDCDRDEAIARLDYLIEHKRVPPMNDSVVMPWFEWAQPFRLHFCPECNHRLDASGECGCGWEAPVEDEVLEEAVAV
jgi:hypothetical protein